MKKERFVNEKELIQHLPVFLPRNYTEAELDKLVDFIEEDMILRKAEEIKLKRAKEKND